MVLAQERVDDVLSHEGPNKMNFGGCSRSEVLVRRPRDHWSTIDHHVDASALGTRMVVEVVRVVDVVLDAC